MAAGRTKPDKLQRLIGGEPWVDPPQDGNHGACENRGPHTSHPTHLSALLPNITYLGVGVNELSALSLWL